MESMKRILVFLMAVVISLTTASVSAQQDFGRLVFKTNDGKTVTVSVDEKLNFSWAGGQLKITGTLDGKPVSETIQISNLSSMQTTGNEVISNGGVKAFFDGNGLFVQSQKTIQSVKVYNMSGQLVVQKTGINSENFVHFGIFPAGIYAVQVDELPGLKVVKR